MADTVFRWLSASGYDGKDVRLWNPINKAIATNAITYAASEDLVSAAPSGKSWYEITASEAIVELVMMLTLEDIALGVTLDTAIFNDVADSAGPYIDGQTAAFIGGAISGTVDSAAIELIRNDDYLEANSRQLAWVETVADKWPDLTSATVVFRVSRDCLEETAVHDDLSVTVTTPTGLQAYKVDAPKALTTKLKPGKYRWQVIATVGTSEITLRRGTLTSIYKINIAA